MLVATCAEEGATFHGSRWAGAPFPPFLHFLHKTLDFLKMELDPHQINSWLGIQTSSSLAMHWIAMVPPPPHRQVPSLPCHALLTGCWQLGVPLAGQMEMELPPPRCPAQWDFLTPLLIIIAGLSSASLHHCSPGRYGPERANPGKYLCVFESLKGWSWQFLRGTVLIIEWGLHYQCTGHGNSFGAWLMDFRAKPKLCPGSYTKSWDLRNYGFVRLSLGFVCSGERDLWGAARIMSLRQKYFFPTLCSDFQQQFLNQLPGMEIQRPILKHWYKFRQNLTWDEESNDVHRVQTIWTLVKDKAENSWVNGTHYQVLLCGTRSLTW